MPRAAGAPAFERLSRQDLANLIVEAADTPMHMAVLTVFEPDVLAATRPQELLARLRADVGSRLADIPELRQVLHRAAPPAGHPVWVDDPGVRIEEHVRLADVPVPGGDRELLNAVAGRLRLLLDRSRPLWEMWLLTGLAGGRWAVLLKVHHSVTDGYGVIRIANSLFDRAPVPGRRAAAWQPAATPSWGRLAVAAGGAAAGTLAGAGAALLHPLRLARSTAAVATTVASITGRIWRGRRAALLHPIGPRRRVEVVRLDLAEVKAVAHAHGVKVNDVLLELASAGVAGALRARGEPTVGVVLRALMAVNLPPSGRAGRRNQAASVLVSLPLDGAGPAQRLSAIAASARRSRRWQSPAAMERTMVLVARWRLGRFLSRHQGAVDLAVSNLVGPPEPLYLLGHRMVEAIPITPISGNVTIDFCALSYAGRLAVGLLADADAWPDLAVVAGAMRDGWRELKAA